MATKYLAKKGQGMGPEEGQAKCTAQLFHGQICALHTHPVSASVAARDTAEEGIINKLGRSCNKWIANFSKTLVMDPGASFRLLLLRPPIATRCQETVLLHRRTRHWLPLCCLSMSPSSPVLLLLSAVTEAWQCSVSQFWHHNWF